MIVLDVHSITSAAGWVFNDGSPVACFALVTAAEQGSLGVLQDKMVIPIRQESLQMDLRGYTVNMIDDSIEYIAVHG